MTVERDLISAYLVRKMGFTFYFLYTVRIDVGKTLRTAKNNLVVGKI